MQQREKKIHSHFNYRFGIYRNVILNSKNQTPSVSWLHTKVNHGDESETSATPRTRYCLFDSFRVRARQKRDIGIRCVIRKEIHSFRRKNFSQTNIFSFSGLFLLFILCQLIINGQNDKLLVIARLLFDFTPKLKHFPQKSMHINKHTICVIYFVIFTRDRSPFALSLAVAKPIKFDGNWNLIF